MTDFESRRAEMLEWQLVRRGIRDQRVLEAMGSVPREEFVEHWLTRDAYADHPLPIGDDQTISQPYIVAVMLQAARVKAADRVLEIGTGSGYVAAVLAAMGAEAWSIERMPGLAATAAERLARLGYDTAHVVVGDGTLGLAEHSPFDAIVVSAAGPSVPDTLLEQLRVGARLVMPVELQSGWQHLVALSRRGSEWHTEALGGVRFVRLIGEHGWH